MREEVNHGSWRRRSGTFASRASRHLAFNISVPSCTSFAHRPLHLHIKYRRTNDIWSKQYTTFPSGEIQIQACSVSCPLFSHFNDLTIKLQSTVNILVHRETCLDAKRHPDRISATVPPSEWLLPYWVSRVDRVKALSIRGESSESTERYPSQPMLLPKLLPFTLWMEMEEYF